MKGSKLLAIVVGLALASACADAETNSPPAGEGGGGGHGGTSSPSPGAQSIDIVSAGQVATNDDHAMVFTMGQPTPNQNVMKSPKHVLVGGLLGATGSLQ